MRATPWLLLVAGLVPLEAAAAPPAPVADLVLRGGRIWAGKGLPGASAIAVKAGRVAALPGDGSTSTRTIKKLTRRMSRSKESSCRLHTHQPEAS